MVPGPGQTHLLYGTMKLVKLGQMSRSITEYSFRELIFTKIFVKLVSWKILVVARLICTLLIPSHIIFFTDLLLSANQFACDLFCKNKNSHTQLKKSNLSHWRYSCFDAVWCREQTKKLYPNLTKKIGIFFWRLWCCCWCEIYWNGEKKLCYSTKKTLKTIVLWSLIQNYIEIYFESCETCCAPPLKWKSQLLVYSQTNKLRNYCWHCSKEKKLNRISFIPPYFCRFDFSCGNKNTQKKLILPSFRPTTL